MKKGEDLKRFNLSSDTMKRLKLKDKDLFKEYLIDQDTVVFKRLSKEEMKEKVFEVADNLLSIENDSINGDLFLLLSSFQEELQRFQQEEKKEINSFIEEVHIVLKEKFDQVYQKDKEIIDFITIDDENNQNGILTILEQPEKEFDFEDILYEFKTNDFHSLYLITNDKVTLHMLQQQLFKWIRKHSGNITMLKQDDFDNANIIIRTATLNDLSNGKIQSFHYKELE